MLKIVKPTKNKVTGGFNSSHRGWDYSGKGDINAYAVFFGKVVQSKNSETRHWLANTSSDPYKPATGKRALKTEDYGNYCKISGKIDGKTYYALYAHLETNTVAKVGTEIKQGDVIGKIDHTGNSSGSHLHFEVRDENDKTIEVEFIDEAIPEPPMANNKKQEIIDTYLGTRPNQPPSDDEINARLQQNKNLVELIKDVLGGDGKAREYWLTEWNVEQSNTNWKETAEQYERTYQDLKDTLSLPHSTDTEKVHGTVKGLLDRIRELEKQQEPKVIYKYEGKDYQKAFNLLGFTLIIEKK